MTQLLMLLARNSPNASQDEAVKKVSTGILGRFGFGKKKEENEGSITPRRAESTGGGIFKKKENTSDYVTKQEFDEKFKEKA